jgi:hypothetical protein
VPLEVKKRQVPLKGKYLSRAKQGKTSEFARQHEARCGEVR